MKYRKKTETVNAFQYLGEECLRGAPEWVTEKILRKCKQPESVVLQENYRANIGDYIIQKRNGEVVVMSQEHFENAYVKEEPIGCCVSVKKIGPIEEFETQEQLEECLRWWQHKLYLDSWMILAHTTDTIVDKCGERQVATEGFNTFEFESSQSSIQILTRESHDNERILFRYCAEKILVHELLHCKYAWMDNQGSYEGVYVCSREHQLLEEMAKSLIMAKYNLDYGYFMGD